MPNHIQNKVTFACSEEKLNEILTALQRDSGEEGEFGPGTVDFNKIIPMPDNIFQRPLGAKERALYRCVRDSPEQLINELTYTLNSRLDFDYVRKILHTRAAELPEVKRAAYFYQIIRQSYASGLDSFGAQPHRMWNNFPLIRQACARLQSVVIENRDFEKLICQYDRPESFFYCDPPYYDTEDYYEDVGFTTQDHERLADVLCGMEGKFLLSYNDCPEIRELYSREGIIIEGTTRLSNIAQRYEAGKQYAELLISNYNTAERYEMERQFSLFDIMHNDKILTERIPIWPQQ